MHDHSLIVLDESDPPHVRGEVEDLINAARRLKAVAPTPEVQQLELIGARRLVLGNLDVDAADPIAAVLEVAHQVMTDKPASSGHQYTSLRAHLLRRRRVRV